MSTLDIGSSANSEKINSIFAYLDEASNNSNTVTKSFTPKHLKDYKYEFLEFNNENMLSQNVMFHHHQHLRQSLNLQLQLKKSPTKH